jgi:membrane-bound lytic murein transglycosylase D
MLCQVPLWAQTIEVPDEMYFLDMKIRIKNSAKNDIASSVAALKKNKTYYQAKLDRIDAYFPIIEKVFAQEGVPEDFKFLAIQESALVSDAVSTSNAVGFWQFKREAALEHGIRIDGTMDERKNITASSKAAADYLKKSNAIFNNWVYALMSYNVGRGGTQRSVNTSYYGANEMIIDGSTHWYVLKCIAHKLAFAEEEGKNPTPPLFLYEYTNGGGKTLEGIAAELSIPEDLLKQYNKWLTRPSDPIPTDRTYWVTVPASYMDKDAIAAKVGGQAVPNPSQTGAVGPYAKPDIKPLPEPKVPNARSQELYPGEVPVFVLINGLEAIKAKQGDDINKLAIQSSISKGKFLKYNDLRVFDEIIPNEYYYIESKHNKAKVPFHIVKPGENLRDISQLYGITIAAIQRKNRMAKTEPLQPGRELWLRSKRPSEIPVKIVPLPKSSPKAPQVETKTVVVPPKQQPVVYKDTTLSPPINTLPPVPVTKEQLPVLTKETPANNPMGSSRSYFKDTVHVVQQGQTLFGIARLYNTKADSLKAWNSLDSTGISINQPLKVKKLVVEQKPGFLQHTVAPGETYYRISDMYKVTVKEIQEWNNKTDFSLSVGETLVIKKK